MNTDLKATEESAAGQVLLTAKELSKILQISTRSIWRLVSAHELPNPLRFGRTVRWRRQDIDSWIDRGCHSGETVDNTLRRK